LKEEGETRRTGVSDHVVRHKTLCGGMNQSRSGEQRGSVKRSRGRSSAERQIIRISRCQHRNCWRESRLRLLRKCASRCITNDSFIRPSLSCSMALCLSLADHGPVIFILVLILEPRATVSPGCSVSQYYGIRFATMILMVLSYKTP
jgi:hypothetical protein